MSNVFLYKKVERSCVLVYLQIGPGRKNMFLRLSKVLNILYTTFAHSYIFSSAMTTSFHHDPVLSDEVMTQLMTEDIESFFDGTLGLGGHAERLLSSFVKLRKYIATDLDGEHLAYAKDRLQAWEEKVSLHQANFSEIGELLKNDTPRPLAILLDLGFCSHHVDDKARGFAYGADGPLDMRYNVEQGVPVSEWLAHADVQEVCNVLRDYGEEPRAWKIAQEIVAKQKEEPLTRTLQLRGIIESVIHSKDQKKAVVRCFQALRIHINDELEHLKKAIYDGVEQMKPGDRMGVMSYHSLEDRIVKQAFGKLCKPVTEATAKSLHEVVVPARARSLSKKPIVPTQEEIERNPRARSAKFRIIEII